MKASGWSIHSVCYSPSLFTPPANAEHLRCDRQCARICAGQKDEYRTTLTPSKLTVWYSLTDIRQRGLCQKAARREWEACWQILPKMQAGMTGLVD